MPSRAPLRNSFRSRYLLILLAALGSLGVASPAFGVVSEPPPHLSETELECQSPVEVGQASNCRVTVRDASPANAAVTPRGTISFTTNRAATFPGSCSLSQVSRGVARCSILYTPNARGTHEITASFAGQTGSETTPALEPSDGLGGLSAQITDATETTVVCLPRVTVPGKPSTCRATVTDPAPAQPSPRISNVFFSTDGPGAFSRPTCQIAFGGDEEQSESAPCSVTYTTNRLTGVPHKITAIYEGDENHKRSEGTTQVRDPNTAISLECDRDRILVNRDVSCTVMVEDPSATPVAPTGLVRLTTDGQATFDSDDCNLGASAGRRAFCQFSYTPDAVGTGAHKITAVYQGDAAHDPTEDATRVHVLSGTVRFAAPGGTGADPCADPARPCSLNVAADKNAPETTVKAGDEIILEAGTYSGRADLGQDIVVNLPDGVFMHGADRSPRPLIAQDSSGAPGAILVGANDYLAHIEIDTNALQGIFFAGDNSTAEGLIVRSTGIVNAVACDLDDANDLVLRDSACLSSGPGATALGADVTIASKQLVSTKLRNITATSTGAGSFGLRFAASGAGQRPTHLVDGVGIIAEGEGTANDVVAVAGGSNLEDAAEIELKLRNSAYQTTVATPRNGGVALVTPAGSAGNILTAPLLAADRVHQLSGSPTIDAGFADGFSGTTDIDGLARTLGKATDIGADEFEPNSETTLSCAPPLLRNGESVTCTATVIDNAAPLGAPSGTVTFTTESTGTFSGGGSCTLGPGEEGRKASCQLTYKTEAIGPHEITAVFQGNATHEASQASTTITAADKGPTTTEIACVPGTVEVNELSTCTARVTDITANPIPLTGGVTFSSSSAQHAFPGGATCTLIGTGDGRTATCSVSYKAEAAGDDTITGSYPGDDDHFASTGSFLLRAVEGHPTQTLLECDPDPVDAGTPATCTATVSDLGAVNRTSPTGGIAFETDSPGDFSAPRCELEPAGPGAASCEVGYLPDVVQSGHHLLGAAYRPDDEDHADSSDTFDLGVTEEGDKHLTVTTIECAPDQVEVGAIANCTATVRDNTGPGATPPSGRVSFAADPPGQFVPNPCNLEPAGPDSASCEVEFNPNVVQSGIHRLKATYGRGQSHFSSSDTFDLGVFEEAEGGGNKHLTTTELACVPGSVKAEEATVCTATVTDAAATGRTIPTGAASFFANGPGEFAQLQCDLEPAGPDSASCQGTYTPIRAGSSPHELGARYLSDGTHASSIGAFDLEVTRGDGDERNTTTTTLNCEPATVETDRLTACTATVRDTTDITGVDKVAPTGRITFDSDSPGNFTPISCELDPVAPDSDTSTCGVNYIPRALIESEPHLLEAGYPGSDQHIESTGFFELEVQQGDGNDTTTALRCDPATVEVNDPANCTATVTGLGPNPTAPQGEVEFTTNDPGDFDPITCDLENPVGAAASCEVDYTPTSATPARHTLTATYKGTPEHNTSDETFGLDVTAEGGNGDAADTSTALRCAPTTVEVNDPANCTATVTGLGPNPTAPQGEVEFTTNDPGDFDPITCDLENPVGAAASCEVDYTPTSATPARHTLTATYKGTPEHNTSDETFGLDVTAEGGNGDAADTSTALRCAPTTVEVNDPANCTATVTGLGPNPTAPQGEVEFTTNDPGDFDPITCDLENPVGAAASCEVDYTPTSATPARHTLTATYKGTPEHNTSDETFGLDVTAEGGNGDAADTSTALRCAPTTVEVNDPANCTATVTGLGPNPTAPQGEVEFTTNDPGDFDPITCDLENSVGAAASCEVDYTPTSATPARHTLTATYKGTPEHNTSDETFGLDVTAEGGNGDAADTSTALRCDPATVEVNDPANCTATVTGLGPNPTAPQGEVEFTTNDPGDFDPITCDLENSVGAAASCEVDYTPTSATPARHTLTATYKGTPEHNTSDETFGLDVTAEGGNGDAADTSTALRCAPTTVEVNDPANCTATVTGLGPNPTAPQGEVEFTTNDPGDFDPITCDLENPVGAAASCEVDYTPTSATPARHTLTATYKGTPEHNTSDETFGLDVTAEGGNGDAADTSTALRCAPTTVEVNDPANCTATVTGLGPNPTAPQGEVEFTTNDPGDFDPITCDLENPVGAAASCEVDYTPTSATPARHTLTATYKGTPEHNTSDDTFGLDVTAEGGNGDAADTSTALRCDPATVEVNDPANCTATVTGLGPNPTAPQGEVEFTTNDPGDFDPITCDLENSVGAAASCEVDYTPTSATPARHTLTATYKGTPEHNTSDDTFGLDVTAEGGNGDAADTSTALRCDPATVEVNDPANCTATVTGLGPNPTAPQGEVEFSTNDPGDFDPITCDLENSVGAAASCEVDYTPTSATPARHTLTATYKGTPEHNTSDETFGLDVTAEGGNGDAADTSTALRCAPTTVEVNDPANCTATVTGLGPNPTAPQGEVEFTTNDPGDFDPITCDLENPVGAAASCEVDYTPTSATPARHTLTATYKGTPEHNTSDETFGLDVTAEGGNGDAADTSTALRCDPATVEVNDPANCTATVTGLGPNPTAPQGEVEFTTNDPGDFDPITCDLENSVGAAASCEVDYTPTSATPARHTLTATYKGTPEHNTSDETFGLNVTAEGGGRDQKNPTATTVDCRPTTVILGGGSVCTAVVEDTGAADRSAPTGIVEFGSASAHSIANVCNLAPTGQATARCQTIYDPEEAGEHEVFADYAGDADHEISGDTAELTVGGRNGGHQTATALECEPSTVILGGASVCTVNVRDIAANPTVPGGGVFFASDSDGDFSTGGCILFAVAQGESRCQLIYEPNAAGNHQITAIYTGDPGHEPSRNAQLLNVTPPNGGLETATALNCAPGSVNVGAATNCTVTVTNVNGAQNRPTRAAIFATDSSGTFNLGGCVLAGAGATSSCQITYRPTERRTGTHTLTAAYEGDLTHEPSQGQTEVTVTEIGNPPPPGTPTGPGTTPPVITPPAPGPVAPNTILRKKPRKKTAKRKAMFKFVADQPGSSYQCKLDKKPFKPCRSPWKKKVKPGRHTFQVRAINPQGMVDPTPAIFKWKVGKVAKASKQKR